MTPPPFVPNRSAALARVDAVDPEAYTRSRNHLQGAATRLSPWLTHGFVSVPEVLQRLAGHGHRGLSMQHKLVQEFGWREYFHSVWRQRGDAIFDSLHAGLLPEGEYDRALPVDIREGRTGIPVIDCAVRALYADGWLHNHARLWLASYVVHGRKVHWSVGADWLYGHLLDGDLASNHLSWQWVAATGSSKPYLFNAENVARFAPPAWHSPDSAIDISYEAFDALARSPRRLPTGPRAAPGCTEPGLFSAPPIALAPPAEARATGQWLQAWQLGLTLGMAAPDVAAPAAPCTGVLVREFHERHPWSAARWQFVLDGFDACGAVAAWGSAAQWQQAALGAAGIAAAADPHTAPWLSGKVWRELPSWLQLPPRKADRILSFSQFWRAVQS